MSATKREIRLLEMIKMINEGKSDYKIRREFKKREEKDLTFKVTKKKFDEDVRLARRIKELSDKGVPPSRILKIIRDEGYGIRDKSLYRIVGNIRPPVKKERKKFICLKNVVIRHAYQPKPLKYELEKLDKPVGEIYKMIEEYEFEEHTVYDEVIVDYYISDKKEDEKYRLCYRRLKSLYHTIFKYCKYLNYHEINDITNDLAFEFSLPEISHRKRCFEILKRIKKILNQKEVKEKR